MTMSFRVHRTFSLLLRAFVVSIPTKIRYSSVAGYIMIIEYMHNYANVTDDLRPSSVSNKSAYKSPIARINATRKVERKYFAQSRSYQNRRNSEIPQLRGPFPRDSPRFRRKKKKKRLFARRKAPRHVHTSYRAIRDDCCQYNENYKILLLRLPPPPSHFPSGIASF